MLSSLLSSSSLLRSSRVAILGHRACLHSSPSSETSKVVRLNSVTPSEHALTRGEEFFAKNERLNRPLSPHLTIYKYQITSILSITHRFTGVIQSGILSGFALFALASPSSFPTMLTLLEQQTNSSFLILAKLAISWPFCYHLLNGVRHLAWDMGWGFNMPDLYKTGYAVMGLSVAMAVTLALM